jgi:hypothetical protein
MMRSLKILKLIAAFGIEAGFFFWRDPKGTEIILQNFIRSVIKDSEFNVAIYIPNKYNMPIHHSYYFSSQKECLRLTLFISDKTDLL